MKRRIIALAVLFLTTAASSPGQELTEAEKKDGFRLLFDGKSFDGWKTSDKTPKAGKSPTACSS